MASKVTEFIRSHTLFTTRELLDECGDGQNSRNLLHLANKSGKVRKVRRGLYVSAMGRYADEDPPYQIIAAKAAPDAVLCHASAFSLFVGSQDVLSQATFYTAKASRPFEYSGMRYVPVSMPAPPVEVWDYRMLNGLTIRGITKERTIADSLAKPLLSGGVEAVLRRFSAIMYLDVDAVISIACRFGPTTCARLGWALEHRREEWDVSDEALASLKALIGRGPYRFGYSTRDSCFDPNWRLILQESKEVMEGWLDG